MAPAAGCGVVGRDMFRRRLGGGGGGGGGDDGRASFAAAVRAGDVAAVRVALAANTTLGRVPLDGTTPPLHEASKLGHHVVVEELLRAGAAVDVADKYGMTPLRVAAAEGHEDVVEQLLRAGVAVNAADKKGPSPLHAAAQMALLLGEDFTPLILEVVRVLVAWGAVVSDESWSPFCHRSTCTCGWPRPPPRGG